MTTTDPTEPKGSEGSSPDEVLCRNCGHRRDWHSRPGLCAGDVLTPQGDDRNNCACKIFWPAYLPMAGPIDLRAIPAAGETAGEPEAPVCRCAGSGFGGEGNCVLHPLRAEPEAPECSHESWEVTGERPVEGGWLKWRKCADCREPLSNLIEAEPHWDLQPAEAEPEPPRRPPYAVAYEIEGGGLFEIALPGDATVRMDDGVLIVMHTQGAVKALIQARPMEGQ